jgi:serine/threonine-protein kinase
VDLLVGRTLGPYEIQAQLGAGGMGVVYRALHRRLGQYRAVKVLPTNLAADPALVMRFEREARLAAELEHPNIVRIFDVGEDDGLHYLVMALLAGRSLQDVLREDQPIPTARAITLLRQLAAALDFAHTRGVVHRDVKPGNAFVGDDDRVTLVDFGIALAAQESRLTDAGRVIGTPEYLAPEVVTGRDAGPSADLYALGIIAYELVTGRVPFTGTNSHAILLAQARDTPPLPTIFRADLPATVQGVLMTQLAKQPDRRFRTGSAFVNALATAFGQAGAPVPPPTQILSGSGYPPPGPIPGAVGGQQPSPSGMYPRGAPPLPTPPAPGGTPLPGGAGRSPVPPGSAGTPLPPRPGPDPGQGSPPPGGTPLPGRPPAPQDWRPAALDRRGSRAPVWLGLAIVLALGLLVLVGIGSSLAKDGRESFVARALLGPAPTATPLPTPTPVPTPTAQPTATPIPGPRFQDLVGTWTAVSSSQNGGPATPETSLRIAITVAGDRSLLLTRLDKADSPIQFDQDRTEGQSLIGTGSSNGDTADMTLLVSQDRSQITMTIRPTQRPGSSSRDAFSLILRRS